MALIKPLCLLMLSFSIIQFYTWRSGESSNLLPKFKRDGTRKRISRLSFCPCHQEYPVVGNFSRGVWDGVSTELHFEVDYLSKAPPGWGVVNTW
jgi:hypothetical protein